MSMSTVHPMPPPTSNALDSTSRTRLLKSTRKLGAVLGTTPLVLEATPATVGPASLALKLSPSKSSTAAAAAKRQRRQGSLFEIPPWELAPPRSSMDSVTSSSSSAIGGNSSLVHLPLLDGYSSCTSASESEGDAPRPRGLAALRARASTKRAAPAPLHLHLFHPPPARTSLDDDQISYPRAPLSPLLVTPGMTTPLTPRTSRAVADTVDGRVRKMSKLTRIYGDRVPHDLVFNGPPRHEEAHQVEDTAESMHAPRSHGRRGTVVGIAHSPIAAVPAVPPLPAFAADISNATRAARRRSASYSITSTPSVLAQGTTDAAVAASRYAQIHNVEGGARAYPTVVCAPLAPSRKGLEGGWIGEWNRNDMREVRDGLRALKAR